MAAHYGEHVIEVYWSILGQSGYRFGRAKCDQIQTSVIVALGQQDLTFPDMVGAADHALLFHFLDDPGGAFVADRKVALDEAGGGLALTGDDGHGAVEQAVLAAAVAA